MKINAEFPNCTQSEFVADLCWTIYATHGCTCPVRYTEQQRAGNFFNSKHPTEIAVLSAAEYLFCQLTGDEPDYSDDEPDDDDEPAPTVPGLPLA